MTKLTAFARMDYLTIRKVSPVASLLIMAVVLMFFAYANGPSMSICMGGLFVTMFISQPFAISEKSNMDALYATLSIDRESVVKGRHLFFLALNIISLVAVFILTLITMLVTADASVSEILSEMLGISAAVFALIILVQALQMPIYFKVGFNKGRFTILVPLFVLYGIFIAFNMARTYTENELAQRITQFVQSINTPGVIALAILLVVAVIYLSVKLSVAFYKKREF